MSKNPIIISVCGKGGVGKTSMSSLLIRMLTKNKNNKVLAIDADPAIGLSTSLGINVKTTVDTVRNNLIERYERGEKTDKAEMIRMIDYELFGALEEKENLGFLAIGRPETDGCYCQVNDLLKDIIKEISNNFDYVVIDAEAGIEQVNRRVMEMVTHLLLVSDGSLKGRNVIETIAEVSKKLISFEKKGALFNRIDEEDIETIEKWNNLPVIGWIPEDKSIKKFDREGITFFDMPDTKITDKFAEYINNFLHN